MLRNPVLRGYVLHYKPYRKGQKRPPPEIVRGPDYMPLRREPVIDDELWARLQAVLDQNGTGTRAKRHDSPLLLRVAFCALCGKPLHGDRWVKYGHEYRRYRCPSRREAISGPGRVCAARSLPSAPLDILVEILFVGLVGEIEILEPVHFPAENHSAELAGIDEAIGHLEDEYAAGSVYKGAAGAARFAALMNKLEARRDHLAAMPSLPARTEYRETGQTFRQRWSASNDHERRQLMIAAGFKTMVSRILIPKPPAAGQRAEVTRGQERTLEGLLRSVGVTSLPAELWDEVRSLADPSCNLVIAFSLDPDLSRRAGLAAQGQPVERADGIDWGEVLAPVQRRLG
jgi:site-specific DNA recombinase